MKTWRLPPRAKVFEALSAVADGRIHLVGANAAEVISSDGTKTYQVTWSDGMQQITSNDNASYWQGYLGYPIIAVLLLRGKIPFAASVARELANVSWKKLNTEYGRDYEAVLQHVLEEVARRGGDPVVIVAEVERILLELEGLSLTQLPKTQRPPRAPK